MILAGLMALVCSALSASSVKTSKAVALTNAEMQSVKGQGYFYVWVWTASSVWDPNYNVWVPNGSAPAPYPAGGGWVPGPSAYVLGAGSGPCSFDGYVYIGGPLAGQSKTQ